MFCENRESTHHQSLASQLTKTSVYRYFNPSSICSLSQFVDVASVVRVKRLSYQQNWLLSLGPCSPSIYYTNYEIEILVWRCLSDIAQFFLYDLCRPFLTYASAKPFDVRLRGWFEGLLVLQTQSVLTQSGEEVRINYDGSDETDATLCKQI